MPEFDFSVRHDAPTAGAARYAGVEEVVDRAQRLIDAPRPYDGYPLEWHFEALNVGDLSAIAMVALRASSSTSASDAP